MGKASQWLRKILTFKKQPSNSNHHNQPQQQQQMSVKEKSRWSFVKSSTKHNRNFSRDGGVFEDEAMVIDPDKHAIAVAAATAAVAEAAVAAAKAAAEVVKLTSSSGRCDSSSYYGCGRFGSGVRQRWAAVVIQSAFRGYLARRALKALKALVRLQALVRGHIARKQTAEQVRQMQALLRVQARARAGRALRSESSQSSSRSSQYHPDPQTPEKFEEIRSRSPRRNQPSPLKRNNSKSESRGAIGLARQTRGTNQANSDGINDRVWDPLMQSCPLSDQPIDKILEVDPGKPYITSKQKNLFHGSHHTWGSDNRSHSLTKDSTIYQVAPGSNPYDALPLTPINITCELEDASFCTAENSPQFFSSSSVGGDSSRRGPFTPTKSDSFHSYLNGYSYYPNYMCYTESSKAKLRSMSAPKQRPQYERSSSTKRQSYQPVSDSKSGSEKLSTSYSSITSEAYPGSRRLEKLGMPVTRGYSYSYASSYRQI